MILKLCDRSRDLEKVPAPEGGLSQKIFGADGGFKAGVDLAVSGDMHGGKAQPHGLTRIAGPALSRKVCIRSREESAEPSGRWSVA